MDNDDVEIVVKQMLKSLQETFDQQQLKQLQTILLLDFIMGLDTHRKHPDLSHDTPGECKTDTPTGTDQPL